jgi:hypothetical protein
MMAMKASIRITNMTNFTNLTNEQVIAEAHKEASNLSYYNAAEGNWDKERREREACYVRYRAVMKEMNARGLEFENRGYLI